MSFYITDGKLTKVYDPDELIEAVSSTVKYYKAHAEALEKENKELHARALEMANEELIDKIQALQEELSLSYLKFASIKEKKAYENFEQRHMHDRLVSKYNSGRAPYLIPTGVGVGTHLEVVCPICGKKENITDTEVW